MSRNIAHRRLVGTGAAEQMAAVFAEMKPDRLGFGFLGEFGGNVAAEFQMGGNFPIVGSELPRFGVVLVGVHDKACALRC